MTINRVPGGKQPLPIQDRGAAAALPRDPLSAKNLVKLTRDLAVGFQDRIFGTEQGRKAAEWLAGQMKAIGLEPGTGDSYFQVFSTKVGKSELTGRNVCGLLRGTDPELSKEVIVVAGHFDSQQDTHVGANDNATGCAGVLAIAQALAKNPPKRSVLFVTFDGEEGLRTKEGYSPGRRGSRFYAANPLAPVEQTALMVNMDELANVHLQSGKRNEVFQWASNDPFATKILKGAFAKAGGDNKPMDGYPEQPREAQFFTTDAEPLYRLGVPVINLLSGRYLENHGPEDDMRLVIPERMEVYGRLAHQCVADAANHAESLKRMGIQPGGLMPTYPLVNERRAAALGIPEEENFRLWDINARMPEIRKLCRSLLTELQKPETKAQLRDVAGLELPKKPFLSEPTLHAVRQRWSALVDAYHQIPKADVAARREAKKALDLLAGAEGVLSASLYLLKLEATGGYYMQRVPERLSELHRGAKRLGFSDKLAGIVETEDTKKFKAVVSADRAVEGARSSVPGLAVALSRAVYALTNPYDAAVTERPADAQDLGELEVALTQAAQRALGKPASGKQDAERAALVGSFLEASLSGIKGSGDKWVQRFAEKNGLLSFALLVGELKIPGAAGEAIAAKAAELDDVLFPPDVDRVKALLPELYALITEAATGKPAVGSLESLIELSRSDLQLFAVEAVQAAKTKVDPEAIALAKDAPEVQSLLALHQVIARTVELQQLFAATPDKKSIYLAEGSSLAEVKARLERVSDALSKLDGGKPVQDELSFWTKWLSPFLPLEGQARMQAKTRKAAAEQGLGEVARLWPQTAERVAQRIELDAGTKNSPVGTQRALEAILRKAEAEAESEQGTSPETLRMKVRAEGAMKLVQPAALALDALGKLTWSASPAAVLQLGQAVEELGHQLGEPAVKELQQVVKRLEALRTQGDVEVGRKERSGPLGVLSIRAAQKRE